MPAGEASARDIGQLKLPVNIGRCINNSAGYKMNYASRAPLGRARRETHQHASPLIRWA